MNEGKNQCDCRCEAAAVERVRMIEKADDNWLTEEEDKKNWEGWLVSKSRIDNIIQIRHAVTKLWQNCEERYPPLPYYTPHGPAHAKSVEDIIHRLLPGDSYKKLKEIERYYLLAAAWTHDIGMIRGINDKEDAKLHPEQIREEHNRRSEQYIVNNYLMLDVEEKDAQALGLLAFFHRKREHIEKCPETFVVGTETVRLRLLAAYVRLADGLDVGQSRAPSSAYAICLAYNIPFTSKLHWIKSRIVSGIAVFPKEQRILVHFKQPHEKELKDFFERKKKKGIEEQKKKEESERLKKQSSQEEQIGDNVNDECISAEEIYDVGLLKQNLARLQLAVMNGLREELDSVKTTLIRGGITCYLDVTSASTEMVIDDQIFPEIIRLADDLDMIVHPSATRLILLLLDTVTHIIDRYLSPLSKTGGCDVYECSSEQCDNSHVCQMPKLIIKEIAEFISDIKENVIDKRRCHIGLYSLVERIDQSIKNGSVKAIKETVKFWNDEIERERREVRFRSYLYLQDRIKNKKKINQDEIRRNIIRGIEKIVKKEYNKDCLAAWQSGCITVLLYGYSELVIKALSGFRDAIVELVITELQKLFSLSPCLALINNLHKINMEKIASSIFRIFVCEGQPKTITAPNDTLQYHDGTRFAIALGRKGFKNVIIIPDLVAGSLLQRGSQVKEESPQIDLVLLGVNGVELLNPDDLKEKENKGKKNVFLHSSGHIAVANLVKQCKKEGNAHGATDPRLVLVLSMSKCRFYGEIDSKEDAKDKSDKADEFEIRQGYRFWKGYGEKTRKESFFSRDVQVQRELSEYEISLYNPREDRVSLSIVDDIISDDRFICDISMDDKTRLLNKAIEDYKKRIKHNDPLYKQSAKKTVDTDNDDTATSCGTSQEISKEQKSATCDHRAKPATESIADANNNDTVAINNNQEGKDQELIKKEKKIPNKEPKGIHLPEQNDNKSS